ncbi:MAG TPA: hypothetical protein VFR03_19910, partial [Thermoanaerobaculia bacterium]|nr:hypothetical protein [Thermoanaerobaculia bacterium]
RLRIELVPEAATGKQRVAGEPVTLNLVTDALRGTTGPVTAFARLVAPAHDLAARVDPRRLSDAIKKEARLARTEKAADGLQLDTARILARLEEKEPELAEVRDEEVQMVTHHESLPHIHLKKTEVPGPYHVGLWIEGTYLPGESGMEQGGAGHGGSGHGDTGHGAGGTQGGERFTRLLNASVGLAPRPK